MRQQPTGDFDAAAKDLAARLRGLPSQMISGFGRREFDVVSEDYVAQTTASRSAAAKPGKPHAEVLDCIARNAVRLGAPYVIVVLENNL